MIYLFLLYIDFWYSRKEGRDIKCNFMGSEMGLILFNIFRIDQIKLDGNLELERLVYIVKRGDVEEDIEYKMNQWDQMV